MALTMGYESAFDPAGLRPTKGGEVVAARANRGWRTFAALLQCHIRFDQRALVEADYKADLGYRLNIRAGEIG